MEIWVVLVWVVQGVRYRGYDEDFEDPMNVLAPIARSEVESIFQDTIPPVRTYMNTPMSHSTTHQYPPSLISSLQSYLPEIFQVRTSLAVVKQQAPAQESTLKFPNTTACTDCP